MMTSTLLSDLTLTEEELRLATEDLSSTHGKIKEGERNLRSLEPSSQAAKNLKKKIIDWHADI